MPEVVIAVHFIASFLASSLCAICISLPQQAVSIVGRWDFSLPSGAKGKTIFVLEIYRGKGEVAARFVVPIMPFGSAQPEGLRFNGTDLSFSLVYEGTTLEFRGSVIGDHIEGTVAQEGARWIATRDVQDIIPSPAELVYRNAVAIPRVSE